MAEKIPSFETTETLLMLQTCRVKEVGADEARSVQPGETVKVSGLDKLELLARNLATRDLSAKVDKLIKEKK